MKKRDFIRKALASKIETSVRVGRCVPTWRYFVELRGYWPNAGRGHFPVIQVFRRVPFAPLIQARDRAQEGAAKYVRWNDEANAARACPREKNDE